MDIKQKRKAKCWGWWDACVQQIEKEIRQAGASYESQVGHGEGDEIGRVLNVSELVGRNFYVSKKWQIEENDDKY